jgi:hypothetical protein
MTAGDSGNCTRDEIVNFVSGQFPEVAARRKALLFGGDDRDLTVSFEKVQADILFSSRER